MALFKSYTSDKRFANIRRLFAVLTLFIGTKAYSGGSCSAIFMENSFPPMVWKDYLQSVQTPIHKTQPMGRVPRENIEPPPEDYRFHMMGQRFVGNPTEASSFTFPMFIEKDIQSEFKQGGSRYNYISSGSESGGPYIIQGKRNHIFNVYDLPRLNEFGTVMEYSQALDKYLSRIEKIIEDRKTSPEYDSLFSAHLLREKIGATEDIVKGMPVAGTRYKTPFSHHTAYPVEVFPDTGMGRIAFREEYDRGDMIVTFIGTKIANRVNASESLLKKGSEEHKKWVIDLVSEIYPDYVKRRHWSESFIKADFTEVLETLNSTDYFIVRKKDPATGKSGELLAALGLNRASYGKARKFDPEVGHWVEFTGAFGSTIYSDYPIARAKLPQDVHFIQEGAVPILKMEAYLGEQFRMPRPSVVEAVFMDPTTPRFVNGEFFGKQPVYMSVGEIFEPVKFYLSRTSTLRSRALSEVFALTSESFFRTERASEVKARGVALYTFNPKTEGSRLYTKRGMQLMPNGENISKDGTDWYVFTSKIEEFFEKFHQPAESEAELERPIAFDSIEATRRWLQRMLPSMNAVRPPLEPNN